MHTMLEFEANGLVIVDPAELYGMVDKGVVVLLNNKPVLREILDFQTGEDGFVSIVDVEEEVCDTEYESTNNDQTIEIDKTLISMTEKKLTGHVRTISAREYVIHQDENQEVMETLVEAMREIEDE